MFPQLQAKGYIVVPFIKRTQLEKLERRFDETILTFPEFKNHNEPILAAFGAFGNPASFHNPFVRKLRKLQQEKALQIFQDIPFTHIEVLFDRMARRDIGKSIGAESWHRDQASKHLLERDDIVLGGWINCNHSTSQYFICVPGTHFTKEPKDGFVKFSKQDSKNLSAQEQKIEIPPGHWILFYQNIAHRVAGGKIKHTQKRLFTGIRLTNSDQPLYDNEKLIEEQGVIRLPGGMMPKMLEKNHLSFHPEKSRSWSTRSLKDICISNGRVHTTMKSLKEYNFPLYPPYTEEDLSVVKPIQI